MAYAFARVDDDLKKQVWNKGKTIPGLDPNAYRKDFCGATMRYTEHGNRNSIQGWEIDHIYPKSLGGSDKLDNLQPLQWQNNAEKGESLSKNFCVVKD